MVQKTALTINTSQIVDGTEIDASDVRMPLEELLAIAKQGQVTVSLQDTDIKVLEDALADLPGGVLFSKVNTGGNEQIEAQLDIRNATAGQVAIIVDDGAGNLSWAWGDAEQEAPGADTIGTLQIQDGAVTYVKLDTTSAGTTGQTLTRTASGMDWEATNDATARANALSNKTQIDANVQSIQRLNFGPTRHLGLPRTQTANALVFRTHDGINPLNVLTYDSLQVSFVARSAITGEATIKIDDLSAIPLRQQNGEALTAGLIGAGDTVFAIYNNGDTAFDCIGIGAAETFLGLPDTPSTYTGQAGKLLAGNPGEDGLVFIDTPETEDAASIRGKLQIREFAPYADISLEPAGIPSNEYPEVVQLHLGDKQTSRTLSRIKVTFIFQEVLNTTTISSTVQAGGSFVPMPLSAQLRRALRDNTQSTETQKQVAVELTFSDSSVHTHNVGFLVNNAAFASGGGSSDVADFTDLDDTPSAYTGQAGKIPAVNTGETALEFIDAPIPDKSDTGLAYRQLASYADAAAITSAVAGNIAWVLEDDENLIHVITREAGKAGFYEIMIPYASLGTTAQVFQTDSTNQAPNVTAALASGGSRTVNISAISGANSFRAWAVSVSAITSSGGLSTVATDDTITGTGATATPIGVANPFTDADESKLDGIAEGAEVNVQSDWNQSDTNADDFIKNKPASLDGVAFTADDRIKLDGIDIGADVNVQADWDQTDTNEDDYIQNKPDILSIERFGILTAATHNPANGVTAIGYATSKGSATGGFGTISGDTVAEVAGLYTIANKTTQDSAFQGVDQGKTYFVLPLDLSGNKAHFVVINSRVYKLGGAIIGRYFEVLEFPGFANGDSYHAQIQFTDGSFWFDRVFLSDSLTELQILPPSIPNMDLATLTTTPMFLHVSTDDVNLDITQADVLINGEAVASGAVFSPVDDFNSVSFTISNDAATALRTSPGVNATRLRVDVSLKNDAGSVLADGRIYLNVGNMGIEAGDIPAPGARVLQVADAADAGDSASYSREDHVHNLALQSGGHLEFNDKKELGVDEDSLNIALVPPYSDVSIHPEGISGNDYPATLWLHLGDKQTGRALSRILVRLAGVEILNSSTTTGFNNGGYVEIALSTQVRTALKTATKETDDYRTGLITLTFDSGPAHTHSFFFLTNNSSFGGETGKQIVEKIDGDTGGDIDFSADGNNLRGQLRNTTTARSRLGLGSLAVKNSLAVADIPDLPTSKVTSGTFSSGRIPGLPASRVTSGTFATSRIPTLPTANIADNAITDAKIADAVPRVRGAYAQSRTYFAGDIVTRSGAVYYCITAHTSPSTGFTAANWDRLDNNVTTERVTAAAYRGLATKDANTLYVVVG